jgi:Protein of unknown function (DUF3575)
LLPLRNKHKLCLICLLLLCIRLHAQKESLDHVLPRFTLKTNLGMLGNPFKWAVTLGTDIRVSRRWSIDPQFGWFLASTTFAKYQRETYRGPRARLGFKYVVDPRGVLYIGAEAKYQSVDNQRFVTVFRQGDQYTQTLLLLRKVETKGANFRMGIQLAEGLKKRFFFDFFLGIGLVQHHVNDSDFPPDATDSQNDFNFPEVRIPTGRSIRATVLGGMHVGWAIW